MTTAISTALPLPTTESIFAQTRRLRRERLLLPLPPALVVLGLWLANHAVSPRTVIAGLVGSIAGYAAAYVAIGLMLRRRIAELEALDRAPAEALLAGWRREIDRRIRNERQAWWLLPVLLVVGHLTFIGLHAPSIGWLVLEILYLAIPLPLSAWRYRRLVRERDELGR